MITISERAVTDLDTSGIHGLEALHQSLHKKEIKLVVANPGPVVTEKLHLSNFVELIGVENVFLTVADAVRRCSPPAGP
ncbi:sulfate transporter 1.2-like [Impatiens glandulifera]|uniref:sulfate transporter 1.2-like n=1 Tax=Impatiens glandulifera TaxID=253017 RepID=UPI001FB0B7BB|nr:sulfate transporter 1.2-like [Impatiens glandulifera]